MATLIRTPDPRERTEDEDPAARDRDPILVRPRARRAGADRLVDVRPASDPCRLGDVRRPSARDALVRGVPSRRRSRSTGRAAQARPGDPATPVSVTESTGGLEALSRRRGPQ